MEVFSRDAHRSIRQGRPQTGIESLHQAADRQGVVAQSQALGQGQGVIDRAGGTPGGGHQQGGDVLRSEGRGGDHRHQGGVDPAAQAQQGSAKAAFARVVPHPQHQGPQQQLVGGRWRLRALGCRVAVPDLHRLPAAGQLQLGDTVGGHHEAAAVEHQLIVAAHLVQVDHGATQAAGCFPRQASS